MYLESITSALMEMRIFEMAHQRKTVIDKTRNLATHIAIHVSKIALYPEHSARKHWIHEVHTALNNIARNKYDGKKKLKPSEYFNLLHDEPIKDTDFVKDTAYSAVHLDKMPNYNWSDSHIEKLNSKIENFYRDVSDKLSTGVIIDTNHTLEHYKL